MVVFGSVGGCALVWERRRASIIYEMEHEGGTHMNISSYTRVLTAGKTG